MVPALPDYGAVMGFLSDGSVPGYGVAGSMAHP